MHRFTVLTALVATAACGLVAPTGAHASDTAKHTLQCSFESQYDVQVERDGIAFTRSDGTPKEVFIHDGQLRVDGRNVAVSAADARRLGAYEHEVRDLVPAIAAIARDGVNVAYSALVTVVTTFANSGDERTRWMQQLTTQQHAALQRIDSSLDKGFWRAGDDSDMFDNSLQDTIASITGDVTRDVVSDALSSDSGKWAELQARTQSLETTIEKAVDGPANKLAQSASQLCPHLAELDRLQQQWEFRLAHGERLELISSDMDSLDKARRYAQR